MSLLGIDTAKLPKSSFLPIGHLQDRVGAHVGALIAKDVAPAMVGAAFAAGWGYLSYSLFTGSHLFKSMHPVWGVVTGIFAVSAAGSSLYNLAAPAA